MMESVVASATAEPSTATSRRAFLIAGVVAATVIVFDQVTKSWAESSLSDGSERHVIWTLRFLLHHNSGMAFSQGLDKGPLIAVVALAVVGMLAWSLRHSRSRLYIICVGLIAGGAVGNVVDRLARAQDGFLSGRVIDFIDFQWWPVFNVADMGVVIGAALLMLDSWRHSRQTRQPS
jgi:signal peptidase II